MTIRLIATDLDGTFFGADHRPEARSVAAMNAAQAAGIICVAVTGRSHMGGAPLATSTGADLDWFIGSNGGHRLNLRTQEMEERYLFADADVAAIRANLEAEADGFAFGWEADDQLFWEQPFIELYPNRLTGNALREEDRIGDGTTPPRVGKMFVAHPDLGHAALIDRLQPHVGDHHATSSGINFAEVTPDGADKGAALARLCAQLDIVPEEVIAFGDNLNDLSMLEWAGRGVAMGNALDEVKAT
ncbi:MAG: HAD-IIB family hydrolase, partial [Actinomycetota bacterium]